MKKTSYFEPALEKIKKLFYNICVRLREKSIKKVNLPTGQDKMKCKLIFLKKYNIIYSTK